MRAIKRYFAIRSYVKLLSGDLRRRFGMKPFYTLDQVSKAIERGGYSREFVDYAHAIYTSQQDFETLIGPFDSACNYNNIRKVVANRYLDGRLGFDAETIILKFASTFDCKMETYESGIGFPGA